MSISGLIMPASPARPGRAAAPTEGAVHQRTLFDDPELTLVHDLRETQHRKYEAILATGKAAVVLAVAKTLQQPFRLNDLSVACHKHDPDFFGMEGYKHHPDNHKIHSFLYGRRGLIRRGHLQRIAEGLFRVPPPEAEPEA
jgi:hypothetical protein